MKICNGGKTIVLRSSFVNIVYKNAVQIIILLNYSKALGT